MLPRGLRAAPTAAPQLLSRLARMERCA